MQDRLAREEDLRDDIEQSKKKADFEIKELKKDIKDLESTIFKVPQSSVWNTVFSMIIKMIFSKL